MTAILHIRLLGDFSLHYGDEPVTGVNTPRLQGLLAYLVLRYDAPQLRQHLACLFWSNSSAALAPASLYRMIKGWTSPEVERTIEGALEPCDTVQHRGPDHPIYPDSSDYRLSSGKKICTASGIGACAGRTG